MFEVHGSEQVENLQPFKKNKKLNEVFSSVEVETNTGYLHML